MHDSLVSRRRAIAAVGQFGLLVAAAACSTNNNGQASPPPTQRPASSPAASPSPQGSPVAGAAPLPLLAPTPGGPPPTVVGVTTTPAPQPGTSPAASPAASPAVAVASPSAQPVAATVMITADRRFNPDQVSVSRGQTVQWRNQSRYPQTVTCNPTLVSNPSVVSRPGGAQPFDSGVINENGAYMHTFDTPGVYQYVSLPFEAQNMFARITVQ